MSLPPGQRAVQGFPRFGTHFHRPAPPIPSDPVIEVGGVVVAPFSFPVTDLATLPRRELTADFHCVSGWSAIDLHWEGVPFATLFHEVIEPEVQPESTITHVVFGGLDRYRSVVTIEDAMGKDVLVADRLGDRPLDTDHGAPVRLVSPSQYGFISTKHLCRIELHAAEPTENYHPSRLLNLGLDLVKPHPRARVWEEERHRHLPAWALRPIYRLLIRPIKSASARGSRKGTS